MSTLRTYNLQNPDSASVNIELTSDGGAVAAGILTSVGGLNVGTGGTVITTTAGGLIGINSTSPAFPLDCDQASSVFAFRSTSGSKEIKIGANDPEVISVGAPLYLTAPSSQDLILRAGGSERLRVDSSGRVTMPYQPMFYAYQTGADYSTSTGIFASTQWNATMINVGNHFDTSNGRFTAPIAGRYVFYGKGLVRWGSSAGHVETTLYKNNSNVTSRGLGYDQMVASNDHANQFFMAYLDLAVDDWVQYGIHALSGGANLYYGENLGSFSGRLVG